MAQIYVAQKALWQGTHPVVLARLIGPNKSLLPPASFGADAFDLRVFDLEDHETPVYTALAQSNASPPFFATLQTDGFWDVDNRGYNFRYTIPTASFTTAVPGGRTIRAEFKFKPTGLGSFWVVVEVPFAAVLSE